MEQKSKLYLKLESYDNKQLLKLVDELKQMTVAEDALVRETLKETELAGSSPILAFVTVSQMLAFVLADRLKKAEERIDDMRYPRCALDM